MAKFYPFSYHQNDDIELKIHKAVTCALFIKYTKAYRSQSYKDKLFIDKMSENILNFWKEFYKYKSLHQQDYFIISIYQKYDIDKNMNELLDYVKFHKCKNEIIIFSDKVMLYICEKKGGIIDHYDTGKHFYIDYLKEIFDNYLDCLDNIIDSMINNNIKHSVLYIDKQKNGHYRFLVSYISYDILSLMIYIEKYEVNNELIKDIKIFLKNYYYYFKKYNNINPNVDEWDSLIDKYTDIIKRIPISIHEELRENSKNEYISYRKNNDKDLFIEKIEKYVVDKPLILKYIDIYLKNVEDELKEMIKTMNKNLYTTMLYHNNDDNNDDNKYDFPVLSINCENESLIDVWWCADTLFPDTILFSIKTNVSSINKHTKNILKSCSLMDPKELVNSIMICLEQIL